MRQELRQGMIGSRQVGGAVRDKGAWIAAWIAASGVRCVKLLEWFKGDFFCLNICVANEINFWRKK